MVVAGVSVNSDTEYVPVPALPTRAVEYTGTKGVLCTGAGALALAAACQYRPSSVTTRLSAPMVALTSTPRVCSERSPARNAARAAEKATVVTPRPTFVEGPT